MHKENKKNKKRSHINDPSLLTSLFIGFLWVPALLRKISTLSNHDDNPLVQETERDDDEEGRGEIDEEEGEGG